MPSIDEWSKSKKNILIYGSTGTGKTQLFSTIPGKLLIYMFDPSGLDTLSGLGLGDRLDFQYFPPDSPIGIGRTKQGKPDPRGSKPKEPRAYADFEDHIESQIEKDFEGYNAVALDSLTSLQPMILDRIAYINGRYGQTNELSDYNIAGDTILKICRALLKCSPIVYITGHSDLVQDDVSKKVQNQFDIVKNVRRLLPRNISDVWVSTVTADMNSTRFQIQTLPSKEWPAAKNSFGLRFTEDVTLDFKKPLDQQGIGAFLANQ
jgi:hypothetical protein